MYLEEYKHMQTNIYIYIFRSHVGSSHFGSSGPRLACDELGAAAVDYLMYSGYVSVAYFWLQMAVTAQQKLDEGSTEIDFYQAKLQSAQFYFDRMLTRTRSLVSAIHSGADNLMNMSEEAFYQG